MLKKYMVVGIIILFLCSSLASGINNLSKDINQTDSKIENDNEPFDKVSVCCQTYGTNRGISKQIEITEIEVKKLLDKISEYASETSNVEKERLQLEVLEIAKDLDLIPEDV